MEVMFVNARWDMSGMEKPAKVHVQLSSKSFCFSCLLKNVYKPQMYTFFFIQMKTNARGVQNHVMHMPIAQTELVVTIASANLDSMAMVQPAWVRH